MTTYTAPIYRRALLKLSGEAFSDPAVQGGIDPTIVRRVAEEIAELKQRHPREAKDELARRVVARFHDEAAAQAASAEFARVFSERQNP
ncbi:MAG: hypothetical protein ACNA8P_03765, partial [Phycisphaerales bacterium]